MLIARRLYVYFIAGVGLSTTVVGLVNLLGLVFARINEALGGAAVQKSAETVRRELSLYVALVIVALPVWLLHWWLAERALRRPGSEGEQERVSAIRAFYLTLALALPLIAMIVSASRIINWLLANVIHGPASSGRAGSRWGALAVLVVAIAVMAYHAWIRHRDERVGPFIGDAAWLPRFYVYGAAFVGAMLLLSGLTDLIRLADDGLFGSRALHFEARWWAEPLRGAIARVLIGLRFGGSTGRCRCERCVAPIGRGRTNGVRYSAGSTSTRSSSSACCSPLVKSVRASTRCSGWRSTCRDYPIKRARRGRFSNRSLSPSRLPRSGCTTASWCSERSRRPKRRRGSTRFVASTRIWSRPWGSPSPA